MDKDARGSALVCRDGFPASLSTAGGPRGADIGAEDPAVGTRGMMTVARAPPPSVLSPSPALSRGSNVSLCWNALASPSFRALGILRSLFLQDHEPEGVSPLNAPAFSPSTLSSISTRVSSSRGRALPVMSLCSLGCRIFAATGVPSRSGLLRSSLSLPCTGP